MKNKIYKKDDNLVIEIPLTTHRSNPYDDTFHPEMPNIVGVIESFVDDKFKTTQEEIGFAYVIDMDYSGKNDQVTKIFYEFCGDKKEFKKLCKELGIEIGIVYSSQKI